MRITALHTYVHGVLISVGEAGSTLAECPDAANAIQGQVRLMGHHLYGDLPDAGVPLQVKLIPSIVQSRLGQALEL